jgi:hypothetical protein
VLPKVISIQLESDSNAYLPTHPPLYLPAATSQPTARPRLRNEVNCDRFQLFMDQQATENKQRDKKVSTLETSMELVLASQTAMQKEFSQMNKSILMLLSHSQRDATPGATLVSESDAPVSNVKAERIVESKRYEVENPVKVSIMAHI